MARNEGDRDQAPKCTAKLLGACGDAALDLEPTDRTLDGSNGPVERNVNRLKTIKRQMYGRAGFDLLRQRVLCAA